ncbi:MAG: hypothetical protein LUQ09_01125 [Methanomassiliicoccales archaeon]|nr:hypothetical protein [Methanomassiliicoccales archaeon]
MGAAVSVIVTQNHVTNTTATGAEPVTLVQSSDATVRDKGFMTNEYTALTDNAVTTIGCINDTQLNVTTTQNLANAVMVFKITKTVGGVAALINSTDIAVKEYQAVNTGGVWANDTHWIPIHLESYGDYVLGYFENDQNGIELTTNMIVEYYFIISFVESGTYQFSWEVLSQDGSG